MVEEVATAAANEGNQQDPNVLSCDSEEIINGNEFQIKAIKGRASMRKDLKSMWSSSNVFVFIFNSIKKIFSISRISEITN